MSIIITGATGFLGRVLTKKLVKACPNEEIVCLVRNKNNSLEKSGRKILKSLNVKTKSIDLTKITTLKNLPKNPRLIIHMAANTDTSDKNHEVNSKGVKNLYEALGGLNQKTHFIHIGTMVSVVGRKNTGRAINEETRDFPTNEYTRTKVEGENYITKQCKADRFRLTIIRPNTIYGKGVRDNSLFDMVKKMIIKKSIITRINWPGKSAIIHVDDLVKAIVFFTKTNPLPGKPQKFLVYAENLSIAEISKLTHKALGIDYHEISIPKEFWQLLKYSKLFIPTLERLLPPKLYNYFWRFSIIIDDVVMCRTSKLSKIIPRWKPKKLADTILDVI